MAATQAGEPTYPHENAYLLVRVAGDLAPHLADKPADRAPALRMAWRMVSAYHPSNEAEVTTAARIVSLSMTQLDLLREVTQPELTPTLKLRYVNAASRLNREIDRAERALERRKLAEERRPVEEQPTEAERINRASNKEAADQAILGRLKADMDLMFAIRRQQEAAAAADPEPAEPAPADPEPLAPSRPVADPVDPPAEPVAKAPPPTAQAARSFFRRTAEAHAQYHAALEAAKSQAGRTPGAGAPPPSAQAAAPE